jgi:hypothetical protein
VRSRTAALAFVVFTISFVMTTCVASNPSRPFDSADPFSDVYLARTLALVSQATHRELALCVHRSGQIEMPILLVSEPRRVTSGGCSPGALVAWHNHPTTDNCSMSSADIAFARVRQLPYIAISDSAGRLCWWTLDQVMALPAGATRYGPVRNQMVFAPEPDATKLGGE